MEFIRRLRHKLHDRYLEKAVEQLGRSHHSLAFDDIQHIGFLFDAEKSDHLKHIRTYIHQLKEKGKTIKALGYFRDNADHKNLEYQTFGKKDVDWYLRPKGFEVETFQRQKFDVLVNCCLSAEPPLEYLAAVSDAQFRIGPITSNPLSYDLMLDVPQIDDMKHYLQRVDFFLNNLNQSKNEPKAV
jgi:hypothetical protein